MPIGKKSKKNRKIFFSSFGKNHEKKTISTRSKMPMFNMKKVKNGEDE